MKKIGSGAVAGAIKTGKGTALMDLDRLKDRFIGALLAPIAASLIRNVLGKGVMRARRGVMRAGTKYNNMNHMSQDL